MFNKNLYNLNGPKHIMNLINYSIITCVGENHPKEKRKNIY